MNTMWTVPSVRRASTRTTEEATGGREISRFYLPSCRRSFQTRKQHWESCTLCLARRETTPICVISLWRPTSSAGDAGARVDGRYKLVLTLNLHAIRQLSGPVTGALTRCAWPVACPGSQLGGGGPAGRKLSWNVSRRGVHYQPVGIPIGGRGYER